MSPTVLAHLQRIARQTRANVSRDNTDQRVMFGRYHGRPIYTVRDYYRPLELTRLYSWCRP